MTPHQFCGSGPVIMNYVSGFLGTFYQRFEEILEKKLRVRYSTKNYKNTS